MAGWSIAMAGVLVMANLAEISAIYLLDLVGDGSLAHNRTVVTALGCAVIAAMTWISLRGVQIGERMQQALLAVQYLALVGFVVGCVIGYSTGTAPHPTAPSLTWFNPLAADGTALGKAILLALFIYWGWDACLALTEETKDPRRTPGRAATLSTVILLITYVGVTVVAIMYAGLGNSGVGLANQDNAEDVFSGLAGEALGPMGWFLVIAVAVSALSSSQTTILPTARGTFAMGIYRALPARFATVDDTTRTPTFSTILVGVVSILYYAGMNLVSTSMLADSILSIGLAIAFFYGIAGYACIWYFRRNLFDSRRHALYRFVLPLLGATFMTWAFIRSAIDMADPGYGSTSLAGVGSTFLIGIGSLLLGVALMLLWARFPAARDFFEKRSLNRDTEILVPD
ncbi:APC family permease [Tsukamurella spumae]|uniref:APC family permease n=1 Tax=Tsukamurella spumae TaxID=44753 RepID=UPI001FED199B|nr:APC family permease [Tsukamurella spumae]